MQHDDEGGSQSLDEAKARGHLIQTYHETYAGNKIHLFRHLNDIGEAVRPLVVGRVVAVSHAAVMIYTLADTAVVSRRFRRVCFFVRPGHLHSLNEVSTVSTAFPPDG